MKLCIRPVAVLSMAAALSIGSAAFAQESPMPKQQKVPPMTGPEGGMTVDKSKMPGMMDMAGMSANMKADHTVNMQLMKFAAMPEEAGDMKFALMAGAGNMTEIEISKAVAEKASDPKVKELAQTIVDEHQKAQDKLLPIGQKLGVTYPDALPTMHQAELTALKNMPTDKMEKAYLSMMKQEHLKAVAMYTDKIPMLKDADLKAYATETLPHIRMHTAKILAANEAMGQPLDLTFKDMPM